MKRPLLILIPIAIGILGGIGIAANNGSKTSPTSTTNQAPISAKPSPTDNPAQVAKETCGDSGSADNWYPVFIDGGDLAEIQAKFCKDAIAKTREKNGKPTVQLASFSDRTRAEKFAKSVRGEVGEPYSLASAKKVEEIPVVQEQQAKPDGELFIEEMERFLANSDHTKHSKSVLRAWKRGEKFSRNVFDSSLSTACEQMQSTPDPDEIALSTFHLNQQANPLAEYQTYYRAIYFAAKAVNRCQEALARQNARLSEVNPGDYVAAQVIDPPSNCRVKGSKDAEVVTVFKDKQSIQVSPLALIGGWHFVPNDRCYIHKSQITL